MSCAYGFALAPAAHASSCLIGGDGGGERGVTGRHGHHRDSCEDLVSKGEEKLGIRKVRLGLSRNSHEGFSNGTLFERVPQ